MIKSFLFVLFLVVTAGVFGQQKANYELAERFRRITQVPLTRIAWKYILVILTIRIVFGIHFARVKGKTIIW